MDSVNKEKIEIMTPKMREFNKSKAGTSDTYNTYKASSENPIPKSDYLKLVNGFFKFLMELIFQGYEIKLPNRGGSIAIIGRKQKPRIIDGEIKGLAPDWVKTKALRDTNPEAKEKRTIVYHLNDHTNGIRYAIRWIKKNMNWENKSFYSIRFSWTNKRLASDLFKEGKEYIVENN